MDFFLSHKTALKEAASPSDAFQERQQEPPGSRHSPEPQGREKGKGKKPSREFSHETQVNKKREISQTHLTCPQGVQNCFETRFVIGKKFQP